MIIMLLVKEVCLSKLGDLRAIEIRNNPKKSPDRRWAAARSIYHSKWVEECFFEAETNLRKHILSRISSERKLKVSRILKICE
jgi:hypothetical protein